MVQDHGFARVGTMQVQAIMPPSILNTINTNIFAIQKKILRGINFVKITKKKFQR